MTRAANQYDTAGPEADDVACLITELEAGEVGPLAYGMLQPNPRLWYADRLDDLADDKDLPREERSRLRAAAAYLRRDPPKPETP